MKKYPFLSILLITVLSTCASMKAERKVEGNTFYSSYPEMEARISETLDFQGDKPVKTEAQYTYSEYRVASFLHKFLWTSSQSALEIYFRKCPDVAAYWTHPSYEWKSIDSLETGSCKLGKHTYYYCTYKTDRFYIKSFVRNTPDNMWRVAINYFEPAIGDVDLSLFNKRCENAFTIIK